MKGKIKDNKKGTSLQKPVKKILKKKSGKLKGKFAQNKVSSALSDDIASQVKIIREKSENQEPIKSETSNILQNSEEEEVDELTPGKYDPFNRHFWKPLPTVEKAVQTEAKFIPQFHDVIGYHKQSACVNPKNRFVGEEFNHIKEFLRRKILLSFEREMARIFTNYEDVLYCRRSAENSESLRKAYCLHALNHAFRTRDRILNNNAKEKKTGKVTDAMRDQSFHRAKVLILLPTRRACLAVVRTLASLFPQGSLVSHNKRLDTEFGLSSEEELQQEENRRKLPDYGYGWFQGNSDDHFRIGISVAKKSCKLYMAFEESDIIVASPLGLKTILDGDDNEENDLFFLSSIEVLIIDEVEMLLLQNWSNLVAVLGQMNQRPKRLSAQCSLVRCREWSLTGHGHLYRQNLFFSAISNRLIKGLLAVSNNFEGVAVFPASLPPSPQGGLLPSSLSLKVDLIEVSCPRGSSVDTARLTTFQRRLLPRLRAGQDKQGVLLYVPGYFDLVELRRVLTKENLDICCIDEYTNAKTVDRYRSLFSQGRIRVLLYSERYHFYHRRRLRGIQSLFFYGPSTMPQFTLELCQQAEKGEGEASIPCQVLYHPLEDADQMAQIFGHVFLNKLTL